MKPLPDQGPSFQRLIRLAWGRNYFHFPLSLLCSQLENRHSPRLCDVPHTCIRTSQMALHKIAEANNFINNFRMSVKTTEQFECLSTNVCGNIMNVWWLYDIFLYGTKTQKQKHFGHYICVRNTSFEFWLPALYHIKKAYPTHDPL